MRLSAGIKQEAKTILFYLAILSVFIYALGTKTDALKTEINAAIQTECQAGQTDEILAKYNDVVLSLIQHEAVSEKKDLKDGLAENAANDAALKARLQADLIPIVKQDCSKPFLP